MKQIVNYILKWVWAVLPFYLFTFLPLTVLAQSEFDPQPPGNPGANYWYSEKGEVVVDDFKPGSLDGALNAAIGDADSKDVLSIVVTGIMNGSDFYAIRSLLYKNCTLADLSRCTGISEVPAEAFYESKLETVYLPATIEKIGRYAFSKSNLKSMSVYALTPPELDNGVFYKVKEGLVVYVPAASIQLYMEAEGWKDFTILPIQKDIRRLTVSLPQGTNVKDYEGMWMELQNTKNDQSLYFVMTDKRAYTFNNIIYNTTWDVTLRNERGDVFGQIKDVEVHEKNVAVAFDSLLKPLGVTLAVMTPNGQDVTSQVQVSWTDAAGNYLSQKPAVSGLPEGLSLNCKVTLSKDLAMVYNAPAATAVTVNAQSSVVNVPLSAIPAAQLTGTVTDAATGQPLEGATITATQTFGTYTKPLMATTAVDGTYTLNLFDVPTTVTIAANGYLSQTKDNVQWSMFNVQLLPLTGAVINLGYTFTPCAEAGERGAETEDWYTDYQNIDYTVYNLTQGRAISLFQVQYPQMVLMEDVNDGEELRLTATSRANRFLPVTCKVTIADQQAKATFDIIELGKIQATVLKTTNAAITATLYDGAGRLVASRDYADAKQTFEGLIDGGYTLLSMGKSEMFNTIGNLDGLSQTKLTEGIDYVLSQVAVQSGITSVVDIAEVPLLDESKLYYTGEGTSFTVNKTEVVAGNYVTLTGSLDFKAEYAEDVSQVQLLADIPENCQFVENSVMVGNNIAAYTLNGRRLTIPLESYTERIRFCVVPTTSGSYTPTGMVQFALNGEAITQPIGSAPFSAKDISILVPDRTSIPSIPMRGLAVKGSKVDIYDGEVLVGQTLAKGNGGWFANCPLRHSDNLSTHYIKAVLTTPEGVTITSDVQPVKYNKDGITVKKVMMYHNGRDITFDFQNPSDKADAYSWNPHKNVYTFTIDFTNNDTTMVSDVVVYAKLQNGKWEALDATFDEAKQLWVAAGEFGTAGARSGVVNVRVGFIDKQEVKVNHSQLKSIFTEPTVYDELKDYCQRVDAFFGNYTGSDEDGAALIKLCEEVMLPEDVQEFRAFEESLKTLSENEINAMMNDVLEKEPTDEFEAYGEDTNYDKYYNVTAGDYQHIYRSCEGLTVADVPEGSQKILTEDGSTVYIYTSKTRICYVDFTNNIWYEVYKVSSAATRNDVAEFEYNWQSIIWDSENLKKVAEEIGERAAKASKEVAINQAIANHCTDAASKAYYAQQAAKYAKRAAGLMKMAGRFKHMATVLKGAPLLDMAINSYKYYNKAKSVDDIFKYRRACKDPDANALIDWYEKEAARILKNKAKTYHAANFVANALANMGIGALALVCPLSLFATVPASVAANMTADYFFDTYFDKEISSLRYMYEKAMRLCLRKQYTDWLNSGDDPYGLPYTGSDKDILRDPSGFVYEAVESNRLEGVTATIYQKQRVEDIYGDWTENIVKWNAEEYGQENPLFTDAEGNYRWDVPQGLWQVKFEKAGYETALSEWLPVPPPQLDINVAMHQNVQPLVKDAHAYQDAIVIEFDKYMKTGLLTSENIRVTDANGETLKAGALQMVDEEGGVVTKVRFQAAEPFGTEEVLLTVSNRVMSYAGVRMQDDYQQAFSVGEGRGGEIELRQMVCDSEMSVGYGEPGMITVTVQPADGAAGKLLRASSALPMIVAIETEEVELDANGSAQITVFGNLPGAATITFTVDDSDLKGTTLVNVEELLFKTAAAPTSNIASGVYVDEQTEISLFCVTPDATIYYTLDGSCPCDDTEGRKIYDGTPIIISETTTIKAMAAANGLGESNVVEFNYFVGDPTGIRTKGTVPNVRLASDVRYNLNGQRVNESYKGIIIRNGKKYINK
jgi:hypothetical protein